MDKCQHSVFSDLHLLVRNFRLQPDQTWRCYEILLTRPSKSTENSFTTLLADLRLNLNDKKSADALETLERSLEISSNEKDVNKNILEFLCHFSLNTGCYSEEKQVSWFRVPSIQCDSAQMFHKNSRKLLINSPIKSRPCFLTLTENYEYPSLPKITPNEHDEGFEDSFDTPRSVANVESVAETSVKPIFYSSHDSKILSLLEMGRVSARSNLKTEITSLEFHRNYFHMRTLIENLSSKVSIDETESILIISMDYLLLNFKFMILGIYGEIFCQDANNKFILRQNFSLFGYSIESSHFLLQSLCVISNCIASIERNLENLKHRSQSDILKEFFFTTKTHFGQICDKLIDLCTKENLGKNISLPKFVNNVLEYGPLLESIQQFLSSLENSAEDSDGVLICFIFDQLYDICNGIELFNINITFFRQIFNNFLEIYFQMLKEWISFGKCFWTDFFVQTDPEISKAKDKTFWSNGFGFCENLVPKLLKPFGKEIFIAGKGVGLKNQIVSTENDHDGSRLFDILSCTEKYSLTKPEINSTSESSDCAKDLVYNKISSMLKSIEASKNLVRNIFKDSKLMETIELFREIFLGANGAFFCHLTNRIFSLLLPNDSNDALSEKEFYPSLFNQVLDESIEYGQLNLACLANKNISFRFDREKLRKLEQNMPAQDSFIDPAILDILDLHCDVTWPGNLIVTESGLNWLKRVFNFLLTLRLALWALDDAWRFLKFYADETRILDPHRLTLQQRAMRHFVQNLEVYVRHQTVDVCWAEFCDAMTRCRDDIDEMHAAHTRYTLDVAQRCLLTPKAEPVARHIAKLLHCTTHFRHCILAGNQAGASEAFRAFEARSRALVTVIEKLSSRMYQPHLNELLIRLNFNNYYATGLA